MVAIASYQLLVPTKVTMPQPRGAWVVRERLLARLDAEPWARLTLLVAPAGFGKSTLVTQWLAPQLVLTAPRGGAASRYDQPVRAVAWLTLDEHDQDPLRLLAYLAGAIDRALPDGVPTTMGLLTSSETLPPYVLLQALLVDLSGLQEGLTVVLDDYHLVGAETVHQVVAYMLRHLPAHCRLVILTRSEPPLPLTRLRAERQLLELRAADLRFTPPEAEVLLARLLGQRHDPLLAADLHQQTEGWAIALQLAALAHASGRERGEPPESADHQIADYLADEVLARQPAVIQRTLLLLAVPERFCVPLCAALLDTPEERAMAEARLAQLVRADLFLTGLGREGQWYRFHPLFRDLLQRKLQLTLGEAAVRQLQLRAAAWFAGEGMIEDAVRLYLTGGDQDAAGELVERQMFPEPGRPAPHGPPSYWLRLLPAALIDRRPGLSLIEARLASFAMNIPALEARLQRVEQLLAASGGEGWSPPWPTFGGDLTMLRGTLRYWQARPAEAIAEMQHALALGTVPLLAGQALLILGNAYVAMGRYDEGVQLLRESMAGRSGPPAQLQLVSHLLALCSMHTLAGSMAELARDARELVVAVAQGPSTSLSWFAEAVSGHAAYERSDLGAAAEHFGAVIQRKYQGNAAIYVTCVVGLALIAADQEDWVAAAAYEEEARAFASETGGAFLRNLARGCAARLALARGDVPAAMEAAWAIAPDIHLGPSIWLETPRLTKARVLIAAGDRASLAQADATLGACLGEIEPLHNARLLASTLATQALLRQAQGRSGDALASLERAVRLAAPRGLLRCLMDLGTALRPLLQNLHAAGCEPAFLAQLLVAGAPPAGRRLPQVRQPELPEQLTRREAEVLALLAERWSNQDIAERLVLSINTVRKHTSTIYDKLGVSSRREAVAAARALGLLPPG
jgi:LuxR family transcriptional regulator, maltose regulon positive regulatory protein